MAFTIHLIVSLILAWSALAQLPSTNFMGTNVQRGFILPHSKELKLISSSPVTAVQIDLGRYYGGAQAYNNCNCMYNSGLSMQFTDFGNTKELGQSVALTGFMEPYLVHNDWWQFAFRYGIGFNYLNKVYHATDNPRNLFYSSPISFITYIGLNNTFRLTQKTNLTSSLIFNHISNGGMRMPNKGMNFPTVSLGLEFLSTSRNLERVQIEAIETSRRNCLIYAQTAFSAKTYSSSAVNQGRLLPVFALQLGALYKLVKLSGIGLAAEFVDDQFQRQTLADYQLNIPHQQVGFGAIHAFTFGRWLLSQQYALYAYNRDPAARKAYQRYQLLYRAFDGWYIGGSLKTHRHVADVFDIRMTYSI